MIKKPSDIAKLLNITTKELIDVGIDRLSISSLSHLAKNNPKKYELQMKGIVAEKLNLSIEDLIKYAEVEKDIKNKFIE